METQPTSRFLGINNRLPDFALATEGGQWLSDALNCDVDNAGKLRRRRALGVIQAMANADSLLATSDTAGYFQRGGNIYSFTTSPTYAETLVATLNFSTPLSWGEYAGVAYYSNGSDSGRIEGGVSRPWGLATPLAPGCSAISGSMDAGTYQAAVSYYNSVTKEEGGLSAAATQQLATNGGVRVVLPGASAGATHVNVYLSTVNGSVPMLIGSYAIGTAQVNVSAEPTRLREGSDRPEYPLPAGTQIFVANGRLCSVSGARINVGLPARPGYYVPIDGRARAEGAPPDYGYITFPAPVDLVVPTESGVYVAYGDITQFFAGTDLASVEMVRDVLPYGAVPGTAFSMPRGKAAVGWFGDHGIVLGSAQGEVVDTMIDNVDLTAPASGASIVIESDGYARVVSCGWCLNIENNAVTRYDGWAVTSASGGMVTTAAGLYNLNGTGPVNAHFDLGKNNFGSEMLKGLPACYLDVASKTPMELRVSTPDHKDYRYLARSHSEDLRIHRVDPGKGLRATWYENSIYNTEGSDFTLASASFAPASSGRRI